MYNLVHIYILRLSTVFWWWWSCCYKTWMDCCHHKGWVTINFRYSRSYTDTLMYQLVIQLVFPYSWLKALKIMYPWIPDKFHRTRWSLQYHHTKGKDGYLPSAKYTHTDIGLTESWSNSTGTVCCVEGITHGYGTHQVERRLSGNLLSETW